MILDPKQLKIALVSAAIFAGMGLFPPWTYTLDSQSLHREKPAGYSLIFFPPAPEAAAPAYGVRLDVARLVVQWIALLVAAGAMLASSKVFAARSHSTGQIAPRSSPTKPRDDAIYINAGRGAIVWIMSRGEERLAVVGALLTSQFLMAMQEGWTTRALQQPEGSGRIEVNLKPCEISDQESRELARTMRAMTRPADDDKMRAIVKQIDTMVSFFERGRFRIDKAPDSLPSPTDESLLVWRP